MTDQRKDIQPPGMNAGRAMEAGGAMYDTRETHDEQLSAAWRAHADEKPPPALDNAILAAAHRAVGSTPRSTDGKPRHHWRAWAPLAVAATLGVVALGIVQMAPREPDATRQVASDTPTADPRSVNAPAENAAPAAAGKPSGAPATPGARATLQAPAALRAPSGAPAATAAATSGTPPAAPGPADRSTSAATQQAAVPAIAPSSESTVKLEALPARPHPQAFPAAPSAAPSVETPPTDPQRLRGMARKDARAQSTDRLDEERAAMGGTSATSQLAPQPAPRPAAQPAPRPALQSAAQPAPEPAPPPAAAPAQAFARDATESASAARAAAARTAQDFIEEMRRLRTAGRDTEAAVTLAAFRSAYPDADNRLPADLRLWAMRVSR